MAQDFLYPGGILSLQKEAALRLLRQGNGDAALYYLSLLAGDEARAGLAWSEERVAAAQSVLIALSLLDPTQLPTGQVVAKPEPETPPDYGQEDVRAAFARPDGFRGLVGEMERALGRLLSPADLQTLLLLYDYLALPPELILLLTRHQMTEIAKKYGPGRKPTMSQIKKEAFRWQRQGVDTLERAEEHLQALEKRATAAARILPLLDIHGRAAVEGEKKYLEAWAQMGFEDDALRLAYEKTVLKKQSLNWPYMNSILRSWQQKGLHSRADIMEKERPGRMQQAPLATGTQGAHAAPAQARKDLDRLDRLLSDPSQGKE